jgi:hypothetical protein
MKAKLGYYILEPCIEIWRFFAQNFGRILAIEKSHLKTT